jgi:hypothetical protein
MIGKQIYINNELPRKGDTSKFVSSFRLYSDSNIRMFLYGYSSQSNSNIFSSYADLSEINFVFIIKHLIKRYLIYL